MANRSEVRLRWQKFRKWTDVCDDRDGRYQHPCVYVVTNKNRKPLYIGQTTAVEHETNGVSYSGGLRMRYYGRWPALDASMNDSGNLVFIAKVDPKRAKEIEAQLISQENPEYNKSGTHGAPKKTLALQHEGDMPKFSNSRDTTV